MKTLEAIKIGRSLLQNYDGSQASIVAEILLEYVTGLPSHKFYSTNIEMGESEKTKYFELLDRRLRGEPVQYIIGETVFMGLKLKMSPGVFIPRPETEKIVEIALDLIAPLKKPVVYDVGTGSGAIAISIAKFKKDISVFASDISETALKTASTNIHMYNLEKKITLLKGNLLSPFKGYPVADLMISNPPYIPSDVISELPDDVQREPKTALNGGEGGTAIINRLLRNGWQHLEKTGALLIEIDEANIDSIMIPDFADYRVEKDYYNQVRFLKCWRKK